MSLSTERLPPPEALLEPHTPLLLWSYLIDTHTLLTLSPEQAWGDGVVTAFSCPPETLPLSRYSVVMAAPVPTPGGSLGGTCREGW